jgi:hypothetical protein
MKVGDLVKWTGFIGIVTELVDLDAAGGWLMRVHWTDGKYSSMYEDELEVLDESR